MNVDRISNEDRNAYNRQSDELWVKQKPVTHQQRDLRHNFWVQIPLSQRYAAPLSCLSNYCCIVIDVFAMLLDQQVEGCL